MVTQRSDSPSSSFFTRAGVPATSVRGGTVSPEPTTAPAATSAASPTVARCSTTAFIPISAPSPTVQLSKIAPCPTVTSAPMSVGPCRETCSTTASWMLVRAPTRISCSGSSPRITAPNQTLASASMVTLPMTVAFGATNAVGSIRGWIPA